jgi:hypothetical protein
MSLRSLLINPPPRRDQTFGTTDRPPEGKRRRVKTGRTEQFNIRVKAGFKERVEELAQRDKETIGSLLEAMLAAYEAGRAANDNSVPAAEARDGRTRLVRIWANDAVFDVIGTVAAALKISVSALIEDMLAKKIKELDPTCERFGVVVQRNS